MSSKIPAFLKQKHLKQPLKLFEVVDGFFQMNRETVMPKNIRRIMTCIMFGLGYH